MTEITYLGDKLSAAGKQPDPEKTRAAADMPAPKDQTELQRALGIVNYMSKFIPNLSQKGCIACWRKRVSGNGSTIMHKNGRSSRTVS